MARALLALQGLYYLATAVWSLVSIGSFQAVTGPKVDTWLVKTVGALVGVTGVVMLIGALRKRPSTESLVLATGSAFALAAVDTWYTAKGRISRIYLADAVEEMAAAALLLATAGRSGDR